MNYELRELHGMTELNALPHLEQQIWGAGFATPPELLRAMQDEGALVGGAFLGTELVAFVLGLPTANPSVQHSHALGVISSQRNTGLGAKLKWWQRKWCLQRGISTVRWTFDPVRLANAKLNIAKLGATAKTYFEDYYGIMTGINAGTPSDRIMADWVLEAPNVIARLEGQPLSTRKDHVLVSIPSDFMQLEPATALEWRLQVRQALQQHFSQGYTITNLMLEPNPAYVLEL